MIHLVDEHVAEPLTQEQIGANRAAIRRALFQAKSTGKVDCAGDGCDVTAPVWLMYRCYYCSLWFCGGCGASHFGGKRPEIHPVRPA